MVGRRQPLREAEAVNQGLEDCGEEWPASHGQESWHRPSWLLRSFHATTSPFVYTDSSHLPSVTQVHGKWWGLCTLIHVHLEGGCSLAETWRRVRSIQSFFTKKKRKGVGVSVNVRCWIEIVAKILLRPHADWLDFSATHRLRPANGYQPLTLQDKSNLCIFEMHCCSSMSNQLQQPMCAKTPNFLFDTKCTMQCSRGLGKLPWMRLAATCLRPQSTDTLRNEHLVLT